MSIKDKITPGPWVENPVESLHTDIGHLIEKEKGFTFLTVCRMQFNNPRKDVDKKLILAVPDMLSIIERLAARRKDVCVHPGSKEDMLIGDAEKLLRELNK